MSNFYFIWTKSLRGPVPQIIRAEDGQIALNKREKEDVLAKHALSETELGMQLTELCLKYPAPNVPV